MTSGLPGERVSGDSDDIAEASDPTWGSWFRLVEVELDGSEAEVLMQGPGDRPLLAVQRVGTGRLALLTSDHIWLWARGSRAAVHRPNFSAGWRTG